MPVLDGACPFCAVIEREREREEERERERERENLSRIPK